MPVSFPLIDSLRRAVGVGLASFAGVVSTEAQPTHVDVTYTSGGTARPIPPRVERAQRMTPIAAAKFEFKRAADGGYTAAELDGIQGTLEKDYGTNVAQRVVREMLGKNVDKLTKDGVEWVQAKHASYNGHLQVFEMILRERLKDATAKLVDANFDGKLNESDVLWREGITSKVGMLLADQTRVAAAVKKACEDLASAGCQFGGNKFPSLLWKPVTPDSWTHVVAEGVKPSRAMQDLFKHGDKYTFECATAITIVHYKAMLDLLGPEDFDRICSDLKIGAWVNEDHLQKFRQTTGSRDFEASKERRDSLHVGEWGYYKNWDVSEAGFAAGWQGENVIYLGDGKFFGHPFGITTEEQVLSSLNGQRKEGSTKSAGFLDVRMGLKTELLKEDKVRE
jgi:hypothetical protein